MSQHPELITRLNRLHNMIGAMRDVTDCVALETQICLLESDDDEVRLRWNALTLEIAHLLTTTEKTLEKLSWAKASSQVRALG